MKLFTKIRKWFYLTPEEEYDNGVEFANSILDSKDANTVIVAYNNCRNSMEPTQFDVGALYTFNSCFRLYNIDPDTL